MAVNYSTGADGFRVQKPRRWTEQIFFTMGHLRNYDLSADGKRAVGCFDFAVTSMRKPFNQVNLVLNFFDELRRRAPQSGR